MKIKNGESGLKCSIVHKEYACEYKEAWFLIKLCQTHTVWQWTASASSETCQLCFVSTLEMVLLRHSLAQRNGFKVVMEKQIGVAWFCLVEP